MDTNNLDKPVVDDIFDKLSREKDFQITNLRSKRLISSLLHGDMYKSEIAYHLANDEMLRKNTENVVEGIINPDPVKVLKSERDPVSIDIGYGISTFWKEINSPIDQKINAAVNMKGILDDLSIATDYTESPDMREEIYTELGLDDEKIDELVPEEDRVNYYEALKGHYRNEHMERLNLKDKGMLDVEDETLLNELVDDSMATSYNGRDQTPADFEYNKLVVDEYMEEYGLTADEILELFGSEESGLSVEEIIDEAVNNMKGYISASPDVNQERLDELRSIEVSIELVDGDLDDLNDASIELTDDDLEGLDFDEEELNL